MILRIGAGLSFELSGFPLALAAAVRTYFNHFLDPTNPASDDAIQILVVEGQAVTKSPEPVLLVELPLTIRGNHESLTFDIPGARCSCTTADDRALVHINDSGTLPVAHFTSWMLVAVFFHLAQRRGWVGLHAAAIAIAGKAVLLPGPSGCGKSTLHHQAREHGLAVLSDDLVWICLDGGGFRVVAFPRHTEDGGDPVPTIDDLPLGHIVVPSIVDQGTSQLTPLPAALAVRELMAQGTFLPGAPHARQFFRDLVTISRSVPCSSLAAGPSGDAVPALVRHVTDADKPETTARTATSSGECRQS